MSSSSFCPQFAAVLPTHSSRLTHFKQICIEKYCREHAQWPQMFLPALKGIKPAMLIIIPIFPDFSSKSPFFLAEK